MVSQAPLFDEEEQRVRIVRAIEEARKFAAETEKYRGEVRFYPWSIFFQGVLAATAVVGAGIGVAKLLLG